MQRHLGWLALALAACAGGKDDEPLDTDTDTDVVDTVIADTDVTETGDTAPVETDETDVVVDTDGEHVYLKGRLYCELPTAENPAGTPAAPGFVKITIVQPWTCPPLSGCNLNPNLEVLAEVDVDKDGSFELDFQTGSYTVDELYLYSDNDIGVCGNGYQFTQNPLTSYEDWDDIVIDVDSIFY